MCLSLAGVQSQIPWIQINGELLRMLSITMPMSYGNLKLCFSSAIQSMCHCFYHFFLSFFLPGCFYKFITEMTCGGTQKQDKWRTAHLQILKGGVFRNGWTMDHLWSVKWMIHYLQVNGGLFASLNDRSFVNGVPWPPSLQTSSLQVNNLWFIYVKFDLWVINAAIQDIHQNDSIY